MTFAVTPGLVSIVVANYNHAAYLARRMESLIAQTYQNIEIFVIDDCSPDNSLEILCKYQSNPKVTLVVREVNGGWIAVSNQGLEMSSGEFVIFANCDDDCDPRMIERLVDGMRSNPSAGISYCRSLLIDENNNVLGDDYSIRERAFRQRCASNVLLGKMEMGRFLLYSCVIPNLSAALIRRECLAAVGNFSSEYKVCSDWELFFRISTDFDVFYISESLNKFREHKTTIRSSTKDRVIYEEIFRLLLVQLRALKLTLMERARFRTRVMYLWALHLIPPSFNGLDNFRFHLKSIIQHDPIALFYVPIAFALRFVELLIKLPVRLFKKISE
ncbi:MAG: glycosyltransferase [Cellvibrio sp.]|uniref:glycosyltransferase n=1 Tax=Cellvibrio sp. TaxID=1965322 RepID=UPI00272551FA|nr:glycosyltransferase [Cellvibrio sp.]